MVIYTYFLPKFASVNFVYDELSAQSNEFCIGMLLQTNGTAAVQGYYEPVQFQEQGRVYLFIEYAASAGHYKNMCTHRNEKKDIKHSGKSTHT